MEYNNEELIVSYLLCKLCEEKQTRFEREYFADDGLFQQLLMVEDLLITRYVEQGLAKEDLIAFECHFLRSPGRKMKVEQARARMKE